MYTPKHFSWFELVPSKDYKQYWLWLIDERILKTIDEMREYYNRPIIINDWYWGGKFSLRGLRPFNSGVGAKFSQHCYGRAVDLDVQGVSAEKVRNDIRSGLFPEITCIETGVSWMHLDVRNAKRLLEVKA